MRQRLTSTFTFSHPFSIWIISGYCTFTITYGQYKNIPLLAGLDKMENSAAQLSTFVDRVLAQSNSTQVFLVGHSEGSMMPRYYLRYLGGQSKVGMFSSSSFPLNYRIIVATSKDKAS
jgi:hypothetical protein